MPDMLQPIVVIGQQLKVIPMTSTIQQMEKSSLKQEFSARLTDLCDEKKIPPHGRQTIIAKQFNVSQEAARKWLDGESFPTFERLDAIAEFFNVSFNWIACGRGEKRECAPGVYVTDPMIIHAVKVMEPMPDYAKKEGVQRIDALAEFLAQTKNTKSQ